MSELPTKQPYVNRLAWSELVMMSGFITDEWGVRVVEEVDLTQIWTLMMGLLLIFTNIK